MVASMWSDWLKQARSIKGQTQQQAAASVGVHVQTWSNWERGIKPSSEMLFRIADWAGTTVDKLRPVIEGAA